GAARPDATTLLTNLADATAPATALMAAGDVFTMAGEKDGRTLPPSNFTVTAASTVQDLLNFYQDGLGIDLNVPAVVPPPGGSVANDAVNPVGARLVAPRNPGPPTAPSPAGT